MDHFSNPPFMLKSGSATLLARICSARFRKVAGPRAWHYAGIAMMSAALLFLQGCFFRGSRTNSPTGPAPRVSIAVLPLNIPEPPQASGSRLQGPTLQTLSIASAVMATNVLQGIPDVEQVPLWRTLHAASSLIDKSRRATPSEAAKLANMLSVRWAMTGEIAPNPEGYVLIIDFIPAKSSGIPFRYQRDLQPETLARRVNEALEQFLRYAQHPVPQTKTLTRPVDWSDLFRLAEAIDREYGWFSPPAPGKAQVVYASVLARDPRLASLFFNPDLYAAATAPLSGEASKPAPADGTEPRVKPVQVYRVAAGAAPVREPVEQLSLSPASRTTETPEKSKWAPLEVPPILLFLAEQQADRAQSRADINRRSSLPPYPSASGYGGESVRTAPPRTPGTQYVLQLFASVDKTEAKQTAEDLAQAGVPVRISVIRARRATFYRVSDGTYESPAAASAAGDALIALRMADEYWIRAVAAPAATTRQSLASQSPGTFDAAGSDAGRFQVQVFASIDREKALALAEGLRRIGLQARIEQFKLTEGEDCYRVRLVGYQSRNEAVAAAETLRVQGRIREYWIVS